MLCLALGGGALGFLFYNFNPARIFMGDSGSMYLGFTLSGITLLGTHEMASDIFFVLLVPAAMMGLPIFDTTLVTIMRTLEGRPLSQGGRDHLSHRLVAVGLSERQSVLVLYVLAAGVRQPRTGRSRRPACGSACCWPACTWSSRCSSGRFWPRCASTTRCSSPSSPNRSPIGRWSTA